MHFSSVRLVTRAFESLVGFYATLLDTEPRHLAEGFAELHIGGAVLAISDERLIRLYNDGLATAASNRSAILEFRVDDVASIAQRAREAGMDIAMPVTTMPWGNTSLLLRDPDGSLVNLFSRPA